MKRGIAVAVAASAIALGGLTGCTGTASASPACDNREVGHIAKHGGQLEDDRFHLARGERVTCRPEERHDETRHEPEQRHDESDHHDDNDDHRHREHKWWRND